jgi:PhnB protein
MASANIYLNFKNQTEEAFLFYKSVFGGEFKDFTRFSEIPPSHDMPPLPEADKALIMHVSLPILGASVLMGSDAPESMGFQLTMGNNMHIMLDPGTRAETDRLFDALSKGGAITMPLQDTFWNAYYGSCTDKYGVQWMFNCPQQ